MAKIEFSQGDLLKSKCQILVNPCNTEGVAGKGLSLEFKKLFPKNYKLYVEDCKNGSLVAGGITMHLDRDKIIVNFATKNKWREPSQYDWIKQGLNRLADWYDFSIEADGKEMAIPLLGAGLGGLDARVVQGIMYEDLKHISNPARIVIYNRSLHNKRE